MEFAFWVSLSGKLEAPPSSHLVIRRRERESIPNSRVLTLAQMIADTDRKGLINFPGIKIFYFCGAIERENRIWLPQMNSFPGLLRHSLSALALSVLCSPAFAGEATPDDNARILAGLPPAPGSPLASIAAGAAWQSQAKRLDEAWKRLEKSQLSAASTWAESALGDARKSPPVLYYAFSGPDFLYAGTFFPNCKTYVLCGLEPIGPIPDLEKLPADKVGSSLEHLQASLDSVLSFSFFKTKDMKTDLQHDLLQGTTPILYTFLARLGKTVRSATRITLDKQGDVTPLNPGAATADRAGLINGVKIEFSAGPGGPVQTLYYFSTDISNDGLKKSPGFVNFCKKLDPGAGFVKAASYLMHEDYFSGIRNLLLDRCTFILEDDSGIPAAKFPAQEWELRPYGRYLGPIDLFKERQQPDLAQIYSAAKTTPLPFGIGYRHRQNESNLLLAVRKPGAAKAIAPGATSETVHP